MGFFDKIKSAVNAVTGGAAKVTINYDPQVAKSGGVVNVRIEATSTGAALKSNGAYVDVQVTENIHLHKHDHALLQNELHVSKTIFSQAYPISGPFEMAPGETKVFEGSFTLPTNTYPTYNGHFTTARWEIRGRIEATGNDPDSGFVAFTVNS